MTSVTGRGGPVTTAIEETLRTIHEDASHSNAFAECLSDRARREASEADELLAAGVQDLPLLGVPVGVKELFDVAGAGNSYGSSVRAGLRAGRDAAVVSSLRRAGAVIVGTTRAHEFGWGITTQHRQRGSTTNPWDPSRVPGGSSGGSAAAVARGLIPLAIGSDTGGSIRIPAAFCGVLGLKTTWGRVSRAGGVPLAPSFDTPGFLARDAALLEAAFRACVGADVADPATEINELLYAGGRSNRTNLDDLRVGVDAAQRRLHSKPARREAISSLAAKLAAAGVSVSDVMGPDPTESYEAFVPYQMAEAFDVHHRILGIYPAESENYGDDVRDRLIAASQVTASQYLVARATATALVAQVLRTFDHVDVIASVVGLTGPSSVDHPDTVTLDGKTIPLRNSVMPTTVVQNLAGLPSVTFPHGDDEGIPIGIQLTGPPNSELFLLGVLRELQNAGLAHVPTPPTFVGDR